jgi:hypothetical protein
MINDGIKDIETGNVLSSSQFWNALKNGWENTIGHWIFEAVTN